MDFLKMMKQAQQMRSKAKEVEKNLKSQKFEVENKGVKIVANAKQEILDIIISEELFNKGRNVVEKNVLIMVQEALSKARDKMTEETKKMMGDVDMGSLTNMFK